MEPDCYYDGITDQTIIHALVATGTHGKREKLGDLTCQACKVGFSRRRNTPLYRLKMPSDVVEKVMFLEAHGMETAVLEAVYQARESTIRTWLARGGEHGCKLHDRFFCDLLVEHVQLDALWGKVKRSQAMAYSVLHELKSRLAVFYKKRADFGGADYPVGCGNAQRQG